MVMNIGLLLFSERANLELSSLKRITQDLMPHLLPPWGPLLPSSPYKIASPYTSMERKRQRASGNVCDLPSLFPSLHVKRISQHGGLVCRLSQNEAALMDPQGRILLEQSGLALASSEPEKVLSSTEQAVGVYIGVMHMEYIQFMNGWFPDLVQAIKSSKICKRQA